MTVYHGSEHIIEVPVFNGSKRTNDYGYGFYTTESIDLAKNGHVLTTEMALPIAMKLI